MSFRALRFTAANAGRSGVFRQKKRGLSRDLLACDAKQQLPRPVELIEGCTGDGRNTVLTYPQSDRDEEADAVRMDGDVVMRRARGEDGGRGLVR